MKQFILFILTIVPLQVELLGWMGEDPKPGNFLGSKTCQSAMCHGGAGDISKQYTMWFRHDYHARAYTTLTTARSEQIARGVGIAKPAEDLRCTSCHAHFHTVSDKLEKTASIEEGVSCEACHGSASNWIRSHTRSDYAYEQRVKSGLRDLKDPYVRATTCVGCHQVVEAEIVAAGHPPVHLELDGQSQRQPRHWKESWLGPTLWLTGQLVAAKEMCDKLESKDAPEGLIVQCEAVLHMLIATEIVEDKLLKDFQAKQYAQVAKALEALAKKQKVNSWDDAKVMKLMDQLCARGQLTVGQSHWELRFLTVALERLTLSLAQKKKEALQVELGEIREAFKTSTIDEIVIRNGFKRVQKALGEL